MLADALNRSVQLSTAAFRWLEDCYRPSATRLEPLLGDDDLAEAYCQLLEHKWYLSERAQRDVGLSAALDDYLQRFARGGP